MKGLITRNTHVKYQSSSTHCSKVISKVKVSERRTELQNDRITELQNDRQDKNNMHKNSSIIIVKTFRSSH